MSAQSPRALLLKQSVAAFQGRGNEIIGYWEANPQAGLAELELGARRLCWDCFAVVLESLLRWRSQKLEGFPRCECGRELRHKGRQWRGQKTCMGWIAWQRGLCRAAKTNSLAPSLPAV